MSALSGIYGSQSGVRPVPTADNIMPATGDASASSGIKPGQMITGKIVGMSGDAVQVEVGKGKVLTARLEGNMDLQPGQTVTFALKGTAGQQVTLSPLYTNMNNVSTASSALLAANMTINETTLAMTNSMMEAGMGIDKQGLTDMYQTVSAHPEADVSALVQMKKLGIEINPGTVKQFEAYQNYENQITGHMQNIMEDVHNLFTEMTANGENSKAMQFMDSVLKIFSGESLAGEAGGITMQEGTAENSPLTLPGEKGQATNSLTANPTGNPLQGQNIATLDVVDGKVILKEMQEQGTVKGQPEGAVTSKEAEGTMQDHRLVLADADMLSEKNALESSSENGKIAVSTEIKDKLFAILQDSELRQTLMPEGKETALSAKDIFSVVRTLLQKEGLTEPLKQMLEGKEFKALLRDAMTGQWMLNPEEVGKKQTVDNLYERLTRQTKDLSQVLSQIAKPDSALAGNLSQMNQNLDFMNQMNQMYQYIQLPLKMNGSETTGDLFVYTDKKSLAQNDGNVSALLHLDMPSLGPLDVYASITPEKSVFTKFYLESDEMIDFIAENIHVLNERLEKRGYKMKSEMIKKGEEGDVKELLIKEQGGIPKTTGHLGFDMRA
ncbi:MAG: hypothetical protein E7285_01895 [Lachnospiraceae bacterium]|nr:hypothetical protein [Lachnospiraceae bacterium]